MSNKVFISIIAFLIVGAFGYAVANKKSEPVAARPGIEHEDKGREHATGLDAQPNSAAEAATSGTHDPSPLAWQAYDQEVPDAKITHNMEHGGIVITYNPDLPQEQIAKIKSLFSKPYARQDFQASKALVAPRAVNEAPIVMSSWNRSMKLDSFDEAKMIEYYRSNIGKSPEPTAS